VLSVVLTAFVSAVMKGKFHLSQEAAFAAEQARQLRAWKEQERKAAEALAAKRSRIAADIVRASRCGRTGLV
jgi:hypothetical protein